MRITAHVLLVGLAFVLSSCSGAKADPNLAPGDFREIAIDEPMMTPDPSGTFAVLTVATSIDAICAVAYGETEALGSLATDLDMRGGGHDDHNARLTGLAPDTRYFYRLQGIGPSGRLFQSEVMEFRTPTAAEGSLSGENVAVGAVVTDVSSEFSSGFVGPMAVDGNLGSEWSSAGDGDDAYIVLDLGRVVNVVAVGFHTRSMSDGTATTERFSVTVGGTTFGPFPAGVADVEFSGQYVRFDVNSSTGGNTGAAEVQVFVAP